MVAMAAKFPEVRKELDDLEEARFAIDELTGKTPSAVIKTKIFDSLNMELQDEKIIKPIVAPVEGKVIPLSHWKSFAVAASVVAVLASAIAIFYANKFYEGTAVYCFAPRAICIGWSSESGKARI